MIELGTYRIQSQVIEAGRFPDKESFERKKFSTFYELVMTLCKAVERGEVKVPFEMILTESSGGWEYYMVADIRSTI